MITVILMFLAVTLVIGLVNLIISEPLERPPLRELGSYLGVVVGGISMFTALVVVIAILFQ